MENSTGAKKRYRDTGWKRFSNSSYEYTVNRDREYAGGESKNSTLEQKQAGGAERKASDSEE